MDIINLIEIVVMVVLLMLSAFFSSSETALTTINPYKVRKLKEEKVKGAKTVEKLINAPSHMISTILVGNNIVNIGLSSLATVFFTKKYGAGGPLIATVIVTFLVLIFGEITPKSLAQQNSESIALKFAKPIYTTQLILKPIIYIIDKITTLIIKLLGKENTSSTKITKDEIKTIVDVSEEQGVLRGDETEFIINALDINKDQAVNIMTPRRSMATLDVKMDRDEIFSYLKKHKHSRFPVYEDNIDNIIGTLHVKDLLWPLFKGREIDLRNFLKKPFFGYEYMSVVELFKQMRAKNISLAIIVDEYGGTSGLVSIEDIVEELVGDIDDEYDDDKDFIKINDREYKINSELRIEEVNEYFNLNLNSENNDSIGGYVIEKLERMPKSGDELEEENLKFIILSVNRRKIEKLKIIFKDIP